MHHVQAERPVVGNVVSVLRHCELVPQVIVWRPATEPRIKKKKKTKKMQNDSKMNTKMECGNDPTSQALSKSIISIVKFYCSSRLVVKQ